MAFPLDHARDLPLQVVHQVQSDGRRLQFAWFSSVSCTSCGGALKLSMTVSLNERRGSNDGGGVTMTALVGRMMLVSESRGRDRRSLPRPRVIIEVGRMMRASETRVSRTSLAGPDVVYLDARWRECGHSP
jgi:hypothetical protein